MHHHDHSMHVMGGMDHDMPGMPDHGGHGAPKCSMNMLWNTDIISMSRDFTTWANSLSSSVISFTPS